MKQYNSLTRKGFTLVEVAIVLVVIGVVIAGILIGSSLIASSQAQSFIKQNSQLDAAMRSFETKYRTVPGDSALVEPHGDGDNKVEDQYAVDNNEAIPYNGKGISWHYGDGELPNFWKHLSITGGLKSKGGADYTNALNTRLETDLTSSTAPNMPGVEMAAKGTGIFVTNDNGPLGDLDMVGSYVIGVVTGVTGEGNVQFSNLGPAFTGQQLLTLDGKVDDGKPDSGDIRAFVANTDTQVSSYNVSSKTPAYTAAVRYYRISDSGRQAESDDCGCGDNATCYPEPANCDSSHGTWDQCGNTCNCNLGSWDGTDCVPDCGCGPGATCYAETGNCSENGTWDQCNDTCNCNSSMNWNGTECQSDDCGCGSGVTCYNDPAGACANNGGSWDQCGNTCACSTGSWNSGTEQCELGCNDEQSWCSALGSSWSDCNGCYEPSLGQYTSDYQTFCSYMTSYVDGNYYWDGSNCQYGGMCNDEQSWCSALGSSWTDCNGCYAPSLGQYISDYATYCGYAQTYVDGNYYWDGDSCEYNSCMLSDPGWCSALGYSWDCNNGCYFSNYGYYTTDYSTMCGYMQSYVDGNYYWDGDSCEYNSCMSSDPGWCSALGYSWDCNNGCYFSPLGAYQSDYGTFCSWMSTYVDANYSWTGSSCDYNGCTSAPNWCTNYAYSETWSCNACYITYGPYSGNYIYNEQDFCTYLTNYIDASYWWNSGNNSCEYNSGYCGDGMCNNGENAGSCGDCPESCGDGYCTGSENSSSCSTDCGSGEYCGDGMCNNGENAGNCGDCGESCGDGYCTGSENAGSCSMDCGESCGDGYCTGSENPGNCSNDCGSGYCGDSYCVSGENHDNCSSDCGDSCGDGYCSNYESMYATCQQDCGDICGDLYCTGSENSGNCPGDCGGGGYCGNGSVENSEQCDDGNNNNGDGCDSNCYWEDCGCGMGQQCYNIPAEWCVGTGGASWNPCSNDCDGFTTAESHCQGLYSKSCQAWCTEDQGMAGFDGNGCY